MYPNKRGRYDTLGSATAQFYNTTGTVPSNIKLMTDISYLVTTQPGCTIVVADLPPGCSESDLRGLFSMYGQIKQLKFICNNEAALIEFGEISPPTRLVHMAKINPFFVGQNCVRLEFSKETIIPPYQVKGSNANNPMGDGISRILSIDIAAADYPITVDVLKSICQPHGELIRMFIGERNIDRSVEALVEFGTPEAAKKAKDHLNGADIYSGCCSLTVTYSNLQKVHVASNTTKSWDFTNSNATQDNALNTGQRTLLGPSGANCPPTPAANGSQPNPILPPPGPPMAPPMTAPTHPHMPMQYPGYQYNSHQMYAPNPGYYAQSQYSGYYGSAATPSVPVVQSTTKQFQPIAPVTILPTPAPVHQVTTKGIGIGHATSSLNSSTAPISQTDLSIFDSSEGCVIMIRNLPPMLNCDHLFNLLCLYGNIARIKFLKSRPGCAMVQVGNAEASDFIHRYYNDVCIFGHTLQFSHSKLHELAENDNLGNLDDGSPVMKNYMMDPNNRFRNAVVAAKSRILEPSRTLHFFNIPLNFTPMDVCRIFTEAGAVAPPRVVIFITKPGQKTSLGLVEWDTLSESLEALTVANQRPIYIAGIPHPFHMKLAFSPKPISTDRAELSMMRYPAPPFAATRPDTVIKRAASASGLTDDENDDEDPTAKKPQNGHTLFHQNSHPSTAIDDARAESDS